MILYVGNPKDFTKLLELINDFSKVAGCKVSTQKSLAFLYPNYEQSPKESNKTIPFTVPSKNKIFRNKANQGGERHVY